MPWSPLILTGASILIIGAIWKIFTWALKDISLNLLKRYSPHATMIARLVAGLLFFIIIPTYYVFLISLAAIVIVILFMVASFFSI